MAHSALALSKVPFFLSDSIRIPFVLDDGTQVPSLNLAFRWEGNPQGPLMVIMGGISAGRHVTDMGKQKGWWSDFVGPNRAINTQQVQVLSFDYLGGAGNTTHAEDLETEIPGFRGWVSTVDQARLLASLLDYLGIEQIETVIGSSYGGMVALAFSQLFPNRVQQQIIISAADRSIPQALALRSIQRETVRFGLRSGRPEQGLNLARQLAMVTYRTPKEFNSRFRDGFNQDGETDSILTYLNHCGRKFARKFSAQSFLCLSESIDRHRIEPSQIKTPTELIGILSDQLIPPWQMEEMRENLAGPARLTLIESLYGHDAFLKEIETLSQILCCCIGGNHD